MTDHETKIMQLSQDLHAHMRREELLEAVLTERFNEGNMRMTKIESELEMLSRLSLVLKGFLRSVHVFSALLAAVVALFLWILLEKNVEFNEMRHAIRTQGETMIELIHSSKTQEKDLSAIKESLNRIGGNSK